MTHEHLVNVASELRIYNIWKITGHIQKNKHQEVNCKIMILWRSVVTVVFIYRLLLAFNEKLYTDVYLIFLL